MTEKDSTQRVADAVEELQPEEKIVAGAKMKFSSGVVLRTKKAAPADYIRVLSKSPRPPAPKYKDKQSGQWITDPNHPDHVEAVNAWENAQAEDLLNAMVLLSTEYVSKPKDMEGHMSKAWLEEYEALGWQTLPENKSWRYLNWVLSKVLITDKDYELLQEEVGKLVGVREKDVEQATTFPGSDQESSG